MHPDRATNGATESALKARSLPALPISIGELPDVATHRPGRAHGRIDRVGMERIHLPICVRETSGRLARVPAEADVFVSLDRAEAKGIHMSRLYLAVQEILGKDELGPATLERLLAALVESHADLSHSAEIGVRFDHLVERPALESGHRGWKSYPVEIRSTLENGVHRHLLSLVVTYSSTCPCSAALSRQLASEKFLRTFARPEPLDPETVAAWIASEEGMPATPHSQRSFAELELQLDADASSAEGLSILPIVDQVERVLGTPVQAAVKREDEQAFAALNGANLMFCEDAARCIKQSLDQRPDVADYRVKVRHEESLHPHDAVAVLVKGVEGGLEP